MKTLKIILTSLIVSMLLSINVSAASVPQGQYGMAQATDMEMLFGAQGQGLQLAVLSQEEMEATEGAFWPWVARGAVTGAIGAGAGAWHSYGNGQRGRDVWRSAGRGFVIGAAGGVSTKWLGKRGW